VDASKDQFSSKERTELSTLPVGSPLSSTLLMSSLSWKRLQSAGIRYFESGIAWRVSRVVKRTGMVTLLATGGASVTVCDITADFLTL
jgi:hypothetical protein